ISKIKFIELDTYVNCYKIIRNRFPFNKGYRIISQDTSKNGYRPDFLVFRRTINHYTGSSFFEKVIVEVKSEKRITQCHIRQINGYSMKHSGKHSFIIGKYLIIPSFTDISGVINLIEKSDIKIIRLRGFR